MRPNLFALLVVTGSLLVGCSPAETPSPDPAPATNSPSAAVQTPEASASADAEDAFVEMVTTSIAGKEEALEAALPAEKLTEKYWLERGATYCEQQAGGGLEAPRLDEAVENHFESVLMGSAIRTLCPEESS